MDEETEDLIDRLCVQASMIMEDHHLSAITTSRLVAAAKGECLADLAGAAQDRSTLIAAARVLTRLG